MMSSSSQNPHLTYNDITQWPLTPVSIGHRDLQGGSSLALSRLFYDEHWSKHRVITCLDWSPQVRTVPGWSFPLGTDLGPASPPSILTVIISGENAKLTQDQRLGANSTYVHPSEIDNKHSVRYSPSYKKIYCSTTAKSSSWVKSLRWSKPDVLLDLLDSPTQTFKHLRITILLGAIVWEWCLCSGKGKFHSIHLSNRTQRKHPLT